tara:strand:- start:291 stop:1292 length:1002 start_codon:yes stop_codon:yes gene_type:complete
MRLLYIDNRKYGHNADLHVDFIKFLNDKKYDIIIPYGNHLKSRFARAISIDFSNIGPQLNSIVKKHRPHAILTYNCNGSSYEVGRDNVALYSWVSNWLSKTSIPKFHITTDYCRSGFRQDQADWFRHIGYSAAIFRHRESLKYPLSIPKFWLPFSVDKDLYRRNSQKNLSLKSKSVGFIGAAHDTGSIYANRISAIDYLIEKNMLKTTRVINKDRFKREMLFGKNYVNFLTKNMFNLTCGGTCNFFTAKYLQIPASYSMLVCSDTNGVDILPKDTYIMYDMDNLDDMYDKILFHMNNKNIYNKKVKTLYDYVLSEHSHNKRAIDLRKIIKKYI